MFQCAPAARLPCVQELTPWQSHPQRLRERSVKTIALTNIHWKWKAPITDLCKKKAVNFQQIHSQKINNWMYFSWECNFFVTMAVSYKKCTRKLFWLSGEQTLTSRRVWPLTLIDSTSIGWERMAAVCGGEEGGSHSNLFGISVGGKMTSLTPPEWITSVTFSP